MSLNEIKYVCENCAAAVPVDVYDCECGETNKNYIICGSDGPFRATLQHKYFGCDYWKGKE